MGVGVNPEEYRFFTLVKEKSSPPEDNVIQVLSFYMNQDTVFHTRTIYSFWDCLADIGGLFDSLKYLMYPLMFLTE